MSQPEQPRLSAGDQDMDEDYGKARDWMVERINRLLEELRGKS